MLSVLTVSEFGQMEALLGGLIDHCDDQEQRLVLSLHAQLQEIAQAQVDDQNRLDQLREIASKAQISQ